MDVSALITTEVELTYTCCKWSLDRELVHMSCWIAGTGEVQAQVWLTQRRKPALEERCVSRPLRWELGFAVASLRRLSRIEEIRNKSVLELSRLYTPPWQHDGGGWKMLSTPPSQKWLAHLRLLRFKAWRSLFL